MLTSTLLTSSTIAVLSGLLGSILTVVITKLIELKQKKFEFESDLKREYFKRKLDSIEKASIQFTLLANHLVQLKHFYNAMIRKDNYFDENSQNKMFEALDSSLAKTSSSSMDIANAIYIYLDISHDEINDYKMMQTYLNDIGEMGAIFLDMKIWMEYEDEAKTEEKKVFCEKQLDEIQNKLREKVENVSDSTDKLNEKFWKLQKKMRIELKKYDS